MGVSNDPQELARKFELMITSTERANRAGTQAAAQAVKDNVVPRMAAATGGDMQLSGTGRATQAAGSARKYERKEKRIGVRYRVLTPPQAETRAIVGAVGPAQLIENDIPRHYVYSRFARAVGGPKTRSRSFKDGEGRRRSVDTRNAAKMFGVRVTGDRRAVLRFTNGDVRRWTTAKSTGRRPWRRGVDASRQQVGEVWTTAHRRALVDTFK